MYFGDKIAKSEVAKAEFFNKFFEIVLHTEVHDTLDRNFNKTACTIHKIELTEIQISNVLTSADRKKACSPDRVGIEVLLNFSSALVKSLFSIFQTSLNKGVFPSVWKMGQISPIFKEGDKGNIENYRRISLFCNISKVFEKNIFNKL